jgi:hypothetical protein
MATTTTTPGTKKAWPPKGKDAFPAKGQGKSVTPVGVSSDVKTEVDNDKTKTQIVGQVLQCDNTALKKNDQPQKSKKANGSN